MSTLTSHSVTPRYSGAISPAYNVVLSDDNGPLNLTGCTPSSFTLTLWDINNPANVIAGSGTWAVTDAVNGKAAYQWNSTDLTTPSVYHAFVTVKLPADPGTRAFDPDLIVISSLPIGAIHMATQDVNLLQVSGTAISSSNPVPAQIVNSSAIAVSGTVTASNLGNATDASYAGAPGSIVATSLVALLRGLFDKMSQNAPQAGYVAAYASNAANTTAATDYSFKWGASGTTQVNHVLLNNNTAANIQYELDTAANAGSPVLASGASILLDVPVTALHLYTAANQNVNGASASNIVVRAWL